MADTTLSHRSFLSVNTSDTSTDGAIVDIPRSVIPPSNMSPNPPPKKKWRIYLIRALFGLIFVLLLLLVILYIAMGTQGGTQFILQKITNQTGISLTYLKGNLKDGVWVSDVVIIDDDKLSVKANKAYLKLGWRALITRQVHVVDSHIDKLDIINKSPPSDDPYSYPKIDLPIVLRVDNTQANAVNIIQQQSYFTVNLLDIDIKHATWAGTRIDLDDVAIRVNDDVTVTNAIGYIDLSGDYPLSATADVTVNAITKAYFGVLQVEAHGTLKRTYGKMTGRYHEQKIHGDFVAQGLHDDAPFSAKVYFDKVVLPYATEQNIMLSDGMMTADGVISRIELRINTDLVGKDIPKGRYYGRGVVDKYGMAIPRLVAETASGQLTAQGDMSWKDEYELNIKVQGDDYKVREVIPLEYRDYQAYAPERLTGTLGMRYYYLDKDKDETRFEFELDQKDGEHIELSLAQASKPADAPWRIHADWQNVIRTGVPNLDVIDSKYGTADIRLETGKTIINAHGQINHLSVAPQGEYDIRATVHKGEQVDVSRLIYDGVMGDLTGVGVIHFATQSQPLSWQVDLNTKGLKPNAYFSTPNKTPFELVTGMIIATGRMRDEQGVSVHDIDIKDMRLNAIMQGTKPPNVEIGGTGRVDVRVQKGSVRALDVAFDGDVAQSYLPDFERANVEIVAKGDLARLNISKFTVMNPSAKLSGAGTLDFVDGVGWDIKARLDEVNTAHLSPDGKLAMMITGDLSTSGAYRSERLQNVQAAFDGQLIHDRLPTGALHLDMAGQGSRYRFNQSYRGDAGMLQTAGTLDIDKLGWDVQAQMDELDLSAFIKGVDSHLTGQLHSEGNWQGDVKRFGVDGLNIIGKLNNQDFSATGELRAELDLPADLQAYFRQLKSATNTPKSTDELFSLRQQLETNARQTQQIVKHLYANNLTVHMGDNSARMNGTDKQITATLDVQDLSQIVPSARGVIRGGVILMNDHHALPTLFIDLNAQDIHTADMIVQKATVLGKVVNLANSPSQLLIEVDDIIALGRVVKSARVDFRGTESAHTVVVDTINADVTAHAKIVGGFDRDKMRYMGVLGDGQMKTRFGLLTQRQPAEFSYAIANTHVEIAPHCWQTSQSRLGGVGSVCLQDTLSYTKTSGKVDVALQNLDTSVLSPALPSDIIWQSSLNGKIQADWQKGRPPIINAVLYSDNGRVGVNQDDLGYVEMPYERISIIAQSVDAGLKLRTDIAGSAGQGYADVVLNPYEKNTPISGALSLNDINLAVFRPFFPDMQTLSGMINVAGGVGGTLSRPLFYGNAELTRGQVAVAGVPVTLNDIDISATIRGVNAELIGSFRSGEGKGVLTGEIDWQSKLQAKLGVAGEHLTVSSPPLITAEFSPDIEIIVRPTERYVNIAGVVNVPSATIRPPDSSGDIVSESGDVSVLDRRLTGNINQILAAAKPWSINADIGLDLGDDVVFRGFGAKLPLAGALHLTQSGQGTMKARGMIQVSERVKIDGIGQNLELNYAQIRFNGDVLNPRLSIEGEKQIQGQTVGVRVKGTANNPDITVFNSAGLTEQQAMNALITGRIDESSDIQTSEQSFRSRVTNSLAAAGLNVGLSGTRNITNRIGSVLGLESLTVDASGGSSDTNVNITGYLSPDLYIRYGVGVFNAESQLSMRYQLTRRIYIEATRATESVVDVVYRWKF